MKSFFSLIILGILLFASMLAANAQFAQGISIVFEPAFPRVGQTVTAKAVLGASDPTQTSFQWFLNGKSVAGASGKGKDSFTFTLGAGARTTVDVIAVTAEGTRLETARAATAGQAVIMWWTDTSVPVWYQGKALASPGSTATLYAIPGAGFGENPSNLLYSWTVNLEPHPEVSGIGRNLFDLKVSLVENVTHQVDVRISNADQTIAQEATVLLPTRAPELLVYPLLPTGGVDFSKMLSLFNGNSGETYDFVAQPFFFRPDQLKNIKFIWQVNDKTIEGNFTKPNILTLKTAPGGTSQNTVRVDATGAAPNLQEASAIFYANFR